MINDGISDVPDKTISIFSDMLDGRKQENKDRINNILKKPSKKREWFSPHFYRCLPLTIGNQQGFIISNEFEFSFIWDGTDNLNSVNFLFYEPEEIINTKFSKVQSHFGYGIITISSPFVLRTPPGVNLMTINPPNFIIPNVTVMTGVIETDNLRAPFTFNLKVQMPNVLINVPIGTPLAAFIPIPRGYSDSFKLKFAEDIFDENIVIEELQAISDMGIQRNDIDSTLLNGVNMQYFK